MNSETLPGQTTMEDILTPLYLSKQAYAFLQLPAPDLSSVTTEEDKLQIRREYEVHWLKFTRDKKFIFDPENSISNANQLFLAYSTMSLSASYSIIGGSILVFSVTRKCVPHIIRASLTGLFLFRYMYDIKRNRSNFEKKIDELGLRQKYDFYHK